MDSHSSSINPPRQERSARTEQRLLDAAERVLATEGLAGATVPAIARKAKVSVGTVYRRFPDKEALLRAVVERYIQRLSSSRFEVSPEQIARVSLERHAEGMMAGMVAYYIQNRTLLKAIIQFMLDDPDPSLARQFEAANEVQVSRAVQIVMHHRKRVHHFDPEAGVRFALFAVGCVLRQTILRDSQHAHRFRWAATEAEPLEKSLARMFLGYLGVR